MNFSWESEKERIARFMKISPRKKLVWLGEMHDFMLKFYSRSRKKIFWKMREIAQSGGAKC